MVAERGCESTRMLMGKRTEELVAALWGAKAYRPDGIVTVADLRQKVLEDPTKDLSWIFPGMDAQTYGRRFGELVAVGAGTGVGKTTFIAQQAADDLRQGEPVAIFAFEASLAEIVKRIAGVSVGKQFHISGEGWTPVTLRRPYRCWSKDRRCIFTTTSGPAIGKSFASASASSSTPTTFASSTSTTSQPSRLPLTTSGRPLRR